MLVAGWFRQVRRRRIGWLGRGGRLQNRVVRSNRPAGFRGALRENLLRAFGLQLQFSLELAGRIHRGPGRRGVNTRLGRIRRPARLRGNTLRRNRELHAAIRADSPAASQESLHIEFVPVGARKSDSHDTIITSLRARSAVSGQRSAVSGQFSVFSFQFSVFSFQLSAGFPQGNPDWVAERAPRCSTPSVEGRLYRPRSPRVRCAALMASSFSGFAVASGGAAVYAETAAWRSRLAMKRLRRNLALGAPLKRLTCSDG